MAENHFGIFEELEENRENVTPQPKRKIKKMAKKLKKDVRRIKKEIKVQLAVVAGKPIKFKWTVSADDMHEVILTNTTK